MNTGDKIWVLFLSVIIGLGLGIAEHSVTFGIMAFMSSMSMNILMMITTHKDD